MFFLTTQTNPGSASWSAGSMGGIVYAQTIPSFQSVVTTATVHAFPNVAVTIPANTYQPGDLLIYGFNISIDATSAQATNLDFSLSVPGSVQAYTASYTPPPGDYYNGLYTTNSNMYDLSSPIFYVNGTITVASITPSPINAETRLMGVAANVDYTNPIVITPQVSSAILNSNFDVAIGKVNLMIIRPS